MTKNADAMSDEELDAAAERAAKAVLDTARARRRAEASEALKELERLIAELARRPSHSGDP